MALTPPQFDGVVSLARRIDASAARPTRPVGARWAQSPSIATVGRSCGRIGDLIGPSKTCNDGVRGLTDKNSIPESPALLIALTEPAVESRQPGRLPKAIHRIGHASAILACSLRRLGLRRGEPARFKQRE